MLSLYKPLLVYIGSVALTAYCANLVDKWGSSFPYHKSPTELSDIIINNFGTPLINSPWLPDIVVISLVVLTYSLLVFVYPKNSSSSRSEHFRNGFKRVEYFLYAQAILLTLRCTTNIATVDHLSPRCHKGITGGLWFNNNCHDMIFSGHAGTSVLCTCFSISTKIPKWVKGLILMSGVCGALINVLVGDHYTVDVLLATYISIFVWRMFDEPLQKTYLTAKGKKNQELIVKENGNVVAK